MGEKVVSQAYSSAIFRTTLFLSLLYRTFYSLWLAFVFLDIHESHTVHLDLVSLRPGKAIKSVSSHYVHCSEGASYW